MVAVFCGNRKSAYGRSKSPPSRKGREKDGAPGEAAMFLTGFQITALYGRRSYRSRATLFDKTKGVGNGHGWAATLTSSNKKVLRIAQAEQNNTAAIWGKASSGAHAHRFEVDNPNILPEGSEPVCSKMHSFRTSPLPAGGWTPLKLALRLRAVRQASPSSFARAFHLLSTSAFVLASMTISSGQGLVKPSVGHLRVASMPILEP
jgi:hypothetical protein